MSCRRGWRAGVWGGDDQTRCGVDVVLGWATRGRSVKVMMSPAGLIKHIQTRVVMRVK